MIPLFILGFMLYASALRLFHYFSIRDYRKIPDRVWISWIESPEKAEGEVGEIIRYTQAGVTKPTQVYNRFAEVTAATMLPIDRHISFLNVLVSAAPLIGLLGTVLGMLMTFQSIGTGGGEMTDMMAKGISAALFPPEVGLCVALPGLMMVYMLKRKRDELAAFIARMESYTTQRIRRLYDGAHTKIAEGVEVVKTLRGSDEFDFQMDGLLKQ